MRGLRQAVFGALAAALACGILLGSISVAFVEGGLSIAQVPAPSPAAATAPSQLPAASGTPAGSDPAAAETQPVTPTWTATVPPPTNCPPPPGWTAIMIQPDDSLSGLAQKYAAAPEELSLANCLVTGTLLPGTFLYVPPLPPSPPSPSTRTSTVQPSATPQPTRTEVPCGAPPDWVIYRVKKGDTLSSLSVLLQISVQRLQFANCLGDSTHIWTGQRLRVPFLPPTSTPFPTATSTQTAAPSPPAQPTTAAPPTATAAPLDTPTSSPTLTPAPSDTPIPEDTSTPEPTPTQPLTPVATDPPSPEPSLENQGSP